MFLFSLVAIYLTVGLLITSYRRATSAGESGASAIWIILSGALTAPITAIYNLFKSKPVASAICGVLICVGAMAAAPCCRNGVCPATPLAATEKADAKVLKDAPAQVAPADRKSTDDAPQLVTRRSLRRSHQQLRAAQRRADRDGRFTSPGPQLMDAPPQSVPSSRLCRRYDADRRERQQRR